MMNVATRRLAIRLLSSRSQIQSRTITRIAPSDRLASALSARRWQSSAYGSAAVEAEAPPVASDTAAQATKSEAEANETFDRAASHAASTATNLSSAPASAEQTSAQTVAVETSPDAAHKQGDSSQIFIANLPFGLGEEAYIDFLSGYGPIAKAHLVYQMSGRMTGYGFATFEDPSKNADYVARINGVDFRGRTIAASIAEPGYKEKRAKAHAVAERSTQLFLQGLPRDVETFDIAELIRTIERYLGRRPNSIVVHRFNPQIPRDALELPPRLTRGSAHATFDTYEAANEAFEKWAKLEPGEMQFEGNPLHLERPLPRRPKRGRFEGFQILQKDPPARRSGTVPHGADVPAGGGNFRSY